MLSALFLVVVAVIISACKKDRTNLSPTLLPEGDSLAIAIVDTFSIQTSMLPDDSIYSGKSTWVLLGSYNDPEFGLFESGFAAQLRLASSNVDFGTGSLVCTGVDLLLIYNAVHAYGNYDASTGIAQHSQSFEVFEATEAMTDKLEYSTDVVPGHTGINLIAAGQEQQYLNPSDLDPSNLKPTMRIPLDPTFGQKFLDQSGTSNLADNTNFTAFFNGLVVKTNSTGQVINEGAIAAFDLTDEHSKLRIYYAKNGVADTFDLVFNSSSARYSFLTHYYSGSNAGLALLNAPGQPLLYLQGGAGIAVNVKLPYISKLANIEKIIINKAELVLPIASDLTVYAPPALLLGTIPRAEEGIYNPIIDYMEGSGHYLGSYTAGSDRYTINITRFIQELVEGSRLDPSFDLHASGSGIQYLFSSGLQKSGVLPNRVILNGPEVAADPMKLVIYYSKY